MTFLTEGPLGITIPTVGHGPQAQQSLLAHVRTDGDLSGGGSRILKSQLGRAFRIRGSRWRLIGMGRVGLPLQRSMRL
jgi:hypothetical protein